MIVGSKLATLHELQTVYSLQDAHNLLEVVIVRGENERRAAKHVED